MNFGEDVFALGTVNAAHQSTNTFTVSLNSIQDLFFFFWKRVQFTIEQLKWIMM